MLTGLPPWIQEAREEKKQGSYITFHNLAGYIYDNVKKTPPSYPKDVISPELDDMLTRCLQMYVNILNH
jgi:hypothetical protein